MMNDRFDAQLREHLLGTADTKAADGQLAAVVQSVANTAQRHPIAARLTWSPGRIGPLPTAALRLGLVAAALVAALVVGALYVGSSPGRSTVFEGTWTSIDAADGSAQSIAVGKGSAPAIRFVDHFATGPACRDDAVKVFTADGAGTITIDRLTVTFPDGGGCGLTAVSFGPWTFDFDQATDTIVDEDGTAWTRAEDAFTPPTRGPEPSVPLSAPTPTPTSTSIPTATPKAAACEEFDGSGTYTAQVGENLVVATLPDEPGTTWSGLRNSFSLTRAACKLGGPLTFEASVLTQVAADACAWTFGRADVADAAAAAEALTRQAGIEVTGQAALTIDTNPAVRLDLSIPAGTDVDACGGQLGLWMTTDGSPTGFDPGTTPTVYLIDFNGDIVAFSEVHAAADEATDPALRTEIDSIIGSLEIKVVGGISN